VKESFYPYIFIGLLAYATADTLILAYRDRMLPTQAPPAKPRSQSISEGSQKADFGTIITRNIFSSDGVIPPPLQGDSDRGDEIAPVPSSLPLTLVGTLVHSNPEKSIAAIDVKSKNQVLSYSPKKEIEGMAVVERVERMKVILRNLNTQRLEYIEIRDDQKVSFGTSRPTGASGIVNKISENEFSISRQNLNSQLSNFNELIRQAKALPEKDASGNIYGFRITQIEPGSIYEQLGISNGCIITGVNGNAVTSANQAMELYTNLRTAPRIELQTECDGRRQNKTYNVTQ
jgi:general secretion pathway protein C